MAALSEQLRKGLVDLELNATTEQHEKLLTLLEQLLKWNKTYNLTAIKSANEGLTLHLLDSLTITPYINQLTLLDVGTGAGFPGLPLAIMLPNVQFTLLDSNSKKIRFIRQIIHQLELKNVEVIHSRVEELTGRSFEGIISRAFASIEDMLSLTKHLLKPHGCWLAMKGQYLAEEKASLSAEYQQKNCFQLNVPGLNANRCLVEVEIR